MKRGLMAECHFAYIRLRRLRRLRFRLHHYRNSVFQPGSSWTTSNTTHPYMNAQCISIRVPIYRKMREHMEQQSHFYTGASTEKGGARSEN